MDLEKKWGVQRSIKPAERIRGNFLTKCSIIRKRGEFMGSRNYKIVQTCYNTVTGADRLVLGKSTCPAGSAPVPPDAVPAYTEASATSPTQSGDTTQRHARRYSNASRYQARDDQTEEASSSSSTTTPTSSSSSTE